MLCGTPAAVEDQVVAQVMAASKRVVEVHLGSPIVSEKQRRPLLEKGATTYHGTRAVEKEICATHHRLGSEDEQEKRKRSLGDDGSLFVTVLCADTAWK